MAGRPAGIPAAIDGVLELSAVSWSGSAGGEAATGRRDSSCSEEAVLCRGERRGELSGHTERVGRPGAERARAAGGDGGALCAALGLTTGGARGTATLS